MCEGGEVIEAASFLLLSRVDRKLHKTPRRSSVRLFFFLSFFDQKQGSSSAQWDTGFNASVLGWEASF